MVSFRDDLVYIFSNTTAKSGCNVKRMQLGAELVALVPVSEDGEHTTETLICLRRK